MLVLVVSVARIRYLLPASCKPSRAILASSPPTAARPFSRQAKRIGPALLKISGTMERIPSQDLRKAEA